MHPCEFVEFLRQNLKASSGSADIAVPTVIVGLGNRAGAYAKRSAIIPGYV
jgi:hypothetical protein